MYGLDMCNKNDKIWYEAFKRKDAQYDGRVFVGVKSTGIYCRPVCKARMPKEENCIFFTSAAEAEQAGYRPCLLCRPELAPGLAPVDATVNLVFKAVRKIEENCFEGNSIAAIAESLGCSDRHLRRSFIAELHVSPVQYMQTYRLLLAKNLLMSSKLSVLDVAMASGFGSLRRFNALFKEKYHLTPSDLRKQLSLAVSQTDMVTIFAGYHPPYEWECLLSFFAERAVPGIEVVKNNEYWRTVSLEDMNKRRITGWIKIGHISEKNMLAISISTSLLPVLPQVLARVRIMFDLYCDPAIIYNDLKVMNKVKPDLCILGTRLPGCFNVFEMAVRTILGQQVSIKAAQTLIARFTEKLGIPLQTNIEGLTHIFPTPEMIVHIKEPLENILGKLGITSMRSKAIKSLAFALYTGEVDLTFCSSPEREVEKLLKLPGIGQWTAQYLAMRAMNWPDAFLDTDYGVKKALKTLTSQEISELKTQCSPWGSYATINLWNSLQKG